MTEEYVREKLSQALDAPALGRGTLKERLRSAVISIIMLQPDDFVDDQSRQMFAKLMYLVTDEEADADEGTIAATVSRLNNDAARELAHSSSSQSLELEPNAVHRSERSSGDRVPAQRATTQPVEAPRFRGYVVVK